MEQQTTLRYEGLPAFASALAQMLQEEGVQVTYQPPVEGRGAVTDMAQDVIVNLVTIGSTAAITAAVERFRRRFRDVRVEEEDD